MQAQYQPGIKAANSGVPMPLGEQSAQSKSGLALRKVRQGEASRCRLLLCKLASASRRDEDYNNGEKNSWLCLVTDERQTAEQLPVCSQ